MASSAELEAAPRASIDTIVGERPPGPKGDSSPAGQPTRYEATVPHTVANNTQNQPASPMTRGFRPLRSAEIPQDQRLEWEHIRTQLGLVDVEEGRIDWDIFRNQIGLVEGDENSVNLLKQIKEACLVLLTSPFMVLHSAFKMAAVLCKSLGILFMALAALCKKLTWKPKKCKTGNNDQRSVFIIFQMKTN